MDTALTAGDDLFKIIERNDYNQLHSLLSSDETRPNCLREDRHYSPLTYACANRATECFILLYKHGVKLS